MAASTSKKNNGFLPSLTLIAIAVGGSLLLTYNSLTNIHDTQNLRIPSSAKVGHIDKMLEESGKGWLTNPKTVASTHVKCIEQKYVEKAQRDMDVNNSSINAKIYGASNIPACIVKDGANAKDIEEAIVRIMGLNGQYHIGAIRNLDRGGFTKESYVIKSIHIMTPNS